jgi:hypothetical protein
MDELLAKIKAWSPMAILKAMPFDGGPSSTRTVVLSVNAVVCVALLILTITLSVVCTKQNANVAIAGVLAGALGALVTPMLGFAMSMQKTRYEMAARAAATSSTTVVTPMSVMQASVAGDQRRVE